MENKETTNITYNEWKKLLKSKGSSPIEFINEVLNDMSGKDNSNYTNIPSDMLEKWNKKMKDLVGEEELK